MTITQTVEIPAEGRRIIEVPPEVPAGKTIIAFTPAHSSVNSSEKSEAQDIELFKLHADRLNAEAMDVLSYQVPLFK